MRFWKLGVLILLVPLLLAIAQIGMYFTLGRHWWNLASGLVCVASAVYIIALIVKSIREGV